MSLKDDSIARLEDIEARMRCIPDGAEKAHGFTDTFTIGEFSYGVAMVRHKLEQGGDISSELDGLMSHLVEFEEMSGIHVDPNGYDLDKEEAYDPTILPSNALDM